MFKLKKKVHIEEFEIILYFFNNSLFIKHKKIKILNIFSSFIQYFIYLNEKRIIAGYTWKYYVLMVEFNRNW